MQMWNYRIWICHLTARVSSSSPEIWGIPSPDGKHLAFLRFNSGNNAWELEGF